MSILMLPMLHNSKLISVIAFRSCVRLKYTLDYSLYPKIEEKDIEEKFVRGSGPGGSAVNKNNNCVVLTHLSSGTVVKCHMSRDLQTNRKLAREMLVSKLDDTRNGDKSISSQKKSIDRQKSLNSEKKKVKLNILKETWKAKFLSDYKGQ